MLKFGSICKSKPTGVCVLIVNKFDKNGNFLSMIATMLDKSAFCRDSRYTHR